MHIMQNEAEHDFFLQRYQVKLAGLKMFKYL
jgi:hypothetical protein